MTDQISYHFVTPKIVIIHPVGRMDALSAPRLRDALLETIEKGCQDIVLDLSETTFMDSSGLSTLVAGLKALKKKGGGKILLSRPNQQVQTTLQLTMLNKIFPAYDSVQEALQALPEDA